MLHTMVAKLKNKETPKAETFAERLNALRGTDTYQELADKLRAAGVRVTPQAIHRWCAGGGISPHHLLAVAKFFGVSPSVLFFGEDVTGPGTLSPEGQLVGWAWDLIPERFRKDMRRDIFTLAIAYAPREIGPTEEGFYNRLRTAMQAAEKDKIPS